MSKQVKIMCLIAMAAFIGLLFMAYEFSKPNEKYLHSEINNQNYFDLNLKYNYHKGSVEGDNLKKSLEKALPIISSLKANTKALLVMRHN